MTDDVKVLDEQTKTQITEFLETLKGFDKIDLVDALTDFKLRADAAEAKLANAIAFMDDAEQQARKEGNDATLRFIAAFRVIIGQTS